MKYHERAILSPKHEDVNKLNQQIVSKLPGETTKYRSIDTVIDENEAINYPIEFLNSLEPSGMPPHIGITSKNWSSSNDHSQLRSSEAEPELSCSRVGVPQNLIVYVPNGKTKNIVYPLALK